MLKEVFLIDQGMLVFHYARNREDSETDQAILSSGLLVAIRDFSQTTRADKIESFNTENEFFLFAGMRESDIVLVGVFDRQAPRNVARDALIQIREHIETVEFPQVQGRQLEASKKETIRNTIDAIVVRLFGVEDVEAFMDDFLRGRNDISLAFVVNINEREILAKFARPAPLYNEEQARQFLLLHDTLCRAISKISECETYRHFLIEADGYRIGGCWSGNRISVASGTMQTEPQAVVDVAGKLCNAQSSQAVMTSVQNLELVTKAKVEESGALIVQQGVNLPEITGVFLSTVTNNLDSFVRLVSRRRFSAFKVLFGVNPERILILRPVGDEIEIGIYMT